MGEIKSALEIAMEKIEKLGKASDEELLKWKYMPEGEKLAARYLKEDFDLLAEISKFDKKAVKYVSDGAIEVLCRNIALPRNEIAKKTNKRAMDGIKNLKTDKVGVENVFSKVRRVFNHYVTQGEQQRKQAYEQLKADFTMKMQQAIQQQFGSASGYRIDVERQPQFQEEWRKLQNQFETQYIKVLDEYKHELMAIP
ncbi:MAG: hypothetical protein HY670_06915 [Chloroflexi bacterium]|nr:hypothetical protein [Chloroflexota bacterium]